jgi:hypothetical protein
MTDEPTEERTPQQRQRDALAKSEKPTQFGQPGGNKQSQHIEGASKPWSHRNAMRYIGAQTYDADDKNSVKRVLPRKRTFAQGAALAVFTKALNGDIQANRMVNEQIDGMLVQTNINADIAAIQEMSDGELFEQFKQVAAAIESLATGESWPQLGDGDTTAGGSEEPFA